MDLGEIIQEFAGERGILAGICGAEPLLPPALRASPLGEGGFGLTDIPFSRATEQERADPGLFLPGAKSVIVLARGYGKVTIADENRNNVPRGTISQCAVGRDYHAILWEDLEALAQRLREEYTFEYRIQVDNGPLCERAFAVRAGLGFIGKHRGLITEKFGSLCNLGLLVTTLTPPAALRRPPPPRGGHDCGDCRKCLDACPSGAITEEGLDYRKCVSYLTQKKGELTDEDKGWMTPPALMGHSPRRGGLWLYGCDICAEACPYNAGVPREMVSWDELEPPISGILELSEEEFRERYEKTALYWRGLETLKRNARAARERFNLFSPGIPPPEGRK